VGATSYTTVRNYTVPMEMIAIPRWNVEVKVRHVVLCWIAAALRIVAAFV
jgi:hypothetical protein